jgi:hypothetical protein
VEETVNRQPAHHRENGVTRCEKLGYVGGVSVLFVLIDHDVEDQPGRQ